MNIIKEQKTLASIRKESSIKQSVVALSMHVQEPAISKLEKKRVTDVSIDKLKKYLEAVGGSVDVIITMPDGVEVVV